MERWGGGGEGSRAGEQAEGTAASLCTVSGCPASGEGEGWAVTHSGKLK